MADFTMPRYDLREQIEVVRQAEPKPTFFRDSFFGQEIFSQTEKAEWDEVREGSGMARYVAEDLEVDASEREGYITKEIETPKVQEKRVLGAAELRKRLPGTTVYTMQSQAERAQYFLDGDYLFCMESIDRRVEQQCAQMMVHGRVDIVGKGVNHYIDYELPMKKTLTGTSVWGSAGKPLETLSEMAIALMERGYVPTELIMERSVADVFLADATIKALLDNRRIDLGMIKPGEHTNPFSQAQYFGQFAYPTLGVLNLYTYDGRYKSPETGKPEAYLDTGRILMLTSEAKQNRMIYGAYTFVDENDSFQTVEGRYCPEIFTDRRARTQTVMVTSRPLPAPYKNDSWWTATVL